MSGGHLPKLYTIGYTGRTIDEIAGMAHALSAIVVDIRMSPRSKVDQWSGMRIRSDLEHREVQYHHIPELGNLDYKQRGKIRIANADTGVKKLYRLTYPNTCAILLCACPQADECHRKTVARLMEQHYGFKVEHVGHPGQGRKKTRDEQSQLGLF